MYGRSNRSAQAAGMGGGRAALRSSIGRGKVQGRDRLSRYSGPRARPANPPRSGRAALRTRLRARPAVPRGTRPAIPSAPIKTGPTGPPPVDPRRGIRVPDKPVAPVVRRPQPARPRKPVGRAPVRGGPARPAIPRGRQIPRYPGRGAGGGRAALRSRYRG